MSDLPAGRPAAPPASTALTDFDDAGLEQLKTRMPFADLSKFEANPQVQNLGKQLTVQDMCAFIEHKLSAA